MNHCVPNRRLHPIGAPISQGLVITQPMQGDIVHYVWKEKNDQVYAMMSDLFTCKERGLKHTELLRREQVLEFGDNIDFTENADKEVVDYEKTIKTYETQCLNGKYLLKTLCVLSPEKPRRCWTKAFGFLDISGIQISKQAIPNVTLEFWIEIIVNSNRTISPKFHSFESVAQDDRTVAWEADWNKANKPKTSFSWDHSEDEFDESNYVEKNDEQLLGIMTNLEGVLVGRFDIFCPELKDKRVCVGLWLKDQEVQEPPLGHKLKFDAFYSDVLDTFIAYYYEIFPSPVLHFDVVKLSQTCIYHICLPLVLRPQDLLGRFYVHPYFGLISDPMNLLGILLYIDPLPVAYVHAFVPSPLTRFEIRQVPTEVLELITDSEAQFASQPIVTEGFYLNNHLGIVYSPKYPTEVFQFSDENEWNAYPVGTWIKFSSEYDPSPQEHRHYIYKHSILREKPQLECALVGNNYEFKIEVEFHSNHKHFVVQPPLRIRSRSR
uniref:Uncharacterized protein n=1 Tax=Ditylenchus dipsaci TaxID=166011 RepID=A0A915EQN4_9BILA